MALRTTAFTLCVGLLLQAQTKDPDSKTREPNPSAAAPEAPPFVNCPAGAPLGGMDLQGGAGGRRAPVPHHQSSDGGRYAALCSCSARQREAAGARSLWYSSRKNECRATKTLSLPIRSPRTSRRNGR